MLEGLRWRYAKLHMFFFIDIIIGMKIRNSLLRKRLIKSEGFIESPFDYLTGHHHTIDIFFAHMIIFLINHKIVI